MSDLGPKWLRLARNGTFPDWISVARQIVLKSDMEKKIQDVQFKPESRRKLFYFIDSIEMSKNYMGLWCVDVFILRCILSIFPYFGRLKPKYFYFKSKKTVLIIAKSVLHVFYR